MNSNSKQLLLIFLVFGALFFLIISYHYWFNSGNKFITKLQSQCQNYNFSNDISIIQQATFFNQYRIKDIILLNFTNISYQCQIFLEMCQPLNIQEVNLNRTLHLCFDTSIITNEIDIK